MSCSITQVSPLTTICNAGLNQNTSFISGSITLNIPPGFTNHSLPNMYNNASTLYLQGVIATAFTSNSGVALNAALNPLNIEISNFVYYNATNQLTPSTGVAPSNYADYFGATYGVFYFNLVNVYTSTNSMDLNYAYMSNPTFTGYIAAGFGLSPQAGKVLVKSGNTTFYTSQPLDTAHSAAASTFPVAAGVLKLGFTMGFMCIIAISLLHNFM